MQFCDLGSLEKAIQRRDFHQPETGQPLVVRPGARAAGATYHHCSLPTTCKRTWCASAEHNPGCSCLCATQPTLDMPVSHLLLLHAFACCAVTFLPALF